MKTLAGIGGVAMIGIIVTLFFSFGRRPSDIAIPYNPPVESPDFLIGLAGVAGGPLRAGGTARLLNNGDAFFPALHDALSAAKQSINFAVYIWEEGKASDDVFAVLIERAKAGVQVRVLLDGMGGLHAPDEDIERLEAAGGKVKVFRAARLGKLSRFHKRNHRRAIVIDGSVAFVGGMAVADKWLGNAGDEEHWRDSMVQVTGPLAATVQSAFVDNWAHVADDETAARSWWGRPSSPSSPRPWPRPARASPCTPGSPARPPARTTRCACCSCRPSPPRARSSTSRTRTSCRTRRSARRWSSARSRGWTSASCSRARRRTPSRSGRPATSTSSSSWRRG